MQFIAHYAFPMKISIFGLGYVGAVISGCFAKAGHTVIGVDTDQHKVDLINRGQPPIIEQDLETLIQNGVKTGLIRATTDHAQAILDSEISMICVGTPSKPNGELDLRFAARVCENIGAVLKEKKERHLVVIRSTMLPGSIKNTVQPTLEQASGKKAGTDFGLAINPEFLRESTAVHDFYHPPKTVIGTINKADAALVAKLYDGLPAPVIVTSLETAEMVKYVDNVFHALKITFANEIGLICRSLGVNGHEVMDIFCHDKKLNLSPAYLKPGFAFGGSCLPKDLRALNRLAQTHDVSTPLLQGIALSNEHQIKHAIDVIRQKGKKKIGILGFAFKAGTDDLRESPVVTLAEALLGKGYDIKLYDSHVSLAKLIGTNRKYIEEHIPHISRLMVNSPEEILAHADLIIIGNQDEKFYSLIRKMRSDQVAIDLTANANRPDTPGDYEKISG